MNDKNDYYPYNGENESSDKTLQYRCPPVSWDDMNGLTPYVLLNKMELNASYDVNSFLYDETDENNVQS